MSKTAHQRIVEMAVAYYRDCDRSTDGSVHLSPEEVVCLAETEQFKTEVRQDTGAATTIARVLGKMQDPTVYQRVMQAAKEHRGVEIDKYDVATLSHNNREFQDAAQQDDAADEAEAFSNYVRKIGGDVETYLTWDHAKDFSWEDINLMQEAADVQRRVLHQIENERRIPDQHGINCINLSDKELVERERIREELYPVQKMQEKVVRHLWKIAGGNSADGDRDYRHPKEREPFILARAEPW